LFVSKAPTIVSPPGQQELMLQPSTRKLAIAKLGTGKGLLLSLLFEIKNIEIKNLDAKNNNEIY
jgi:hypothetical protein